MINAPVFQAPAARKFPGKLEIPVRTTDRMERTKIAASKVLQGVNKALESARVDSPAVESLGGAPDVEPLGAIYYSATAFRYGDTIAQFSLRPISDELNELAARENAVREQVREEMADIDARWAFCVQLCRDLDPQPVEDPTVAWDAQKYPFRQLATVAVRPGRLGNGPCRQGRREHAA